MYASGWDDAEWAEEVDGTTSPLRFDTVGEAQIALNEFFIDLKAAVAAGDMDAEENKRHYRIMAVK